MASRLFGATTCNRRQVRGTHTDSVCCSNCRFVRLLAIAMQTSVRPSETNELAVCAFYSATGMNGHCCSLGQTLGCITLETQPNMRRRDGTWHLVAYLDHPKHTGCDCQTIAVDGNPIAPRKRCPRDPVTAIRGGPFHSFKFFRLTNQSDHRLHGQSWSDHSKLIRWLVRIVISLLWEGCCERG